MSKKKIHFVNEDKQIACGQYIGRGWNFTSQKNQVTCEHCKKFIAKEQKVRMESND